MKTNISIIYSLFAKFSANIESWVISSYTYTVFRVVFDISFNHYNGIITGLLSLSYSTPCLYKKSWENTIKVAHIFPQ